MTPFILFIAAAIAVAVYIWIKDDEPFVGSPSGGTPDAGETPKDIDEDHQPLPLPFEDSPK